MRLRFFVRRHLATWRRIALSWFRFLNTVSVAMKAHRAASKEKEAPGLEFDRTGRRIGRRLLLRGQSLGLEYLLHPMESVRYLEFPFVRACMPPRLSRCLDISSPRLFSLHLAIEMQVPVEMCNPDPADTEETQNIISTLGLPTISICRRGVEMLLEPEMQDRFDAIWSISVVEHIEGVYDDSDAVRMMYQALRPGGRLILTVPVDREFRIESSDQQQYGTQPMQSDGKYFFQRYYDAEAIISRLSGPIGQEPTIIRWFGEYQRGWYDRYRASWAQRGLRWGVEDVKEIGRHFCEFDAWDRMPGMGICGLMYERR